MQQAVDHQVRIVGLEALALRPRLRATTAGQTTTSPASGAPRAASYAKVRTLVA
jgi:hypothetical protein